MRIQSDDNVRLRLTLMFISEILSSLAHNTGVKMPTKPKTRKPTEAEKATAEKFMDRLVTNHSKEILDALDGEVKRKLVAEAFDYSVAFHAHEVAA